MKYTKGKCKIPSGRFEKMYKNEMRQHFLKHILLLIVFLDGAKVNSIIKSSPRLFNKKGIIKSSKEFLAILCRDYLHGIGNVFKHLGSVGVTVTYEQRYIEELDYVVSNLATDLRDGIRLTKLAEILRGQNDDSLVGQLRLPAVSRLQKLHNTDCALTFFDEIGIPNIASIQASHIIEGHRPQVLKLLWSIMSSYKLSTLLHPKELMHEIEGIYTSRRYTGAPKEVTFKEGGDICELLLQWCQAVCSCFQYDVKDFSNSFSDGTALGLIIHYYHPAILNREHILPTTSSLKTRGLSVSKSDEFEAALGNERRNCKFANDAMLEIGGIPNMFPLSDTINIPDERTTIICVAYLCSRLLELRTETLAATVIQKAFRKFVGPLNKQKMRNAVLKVEKFWIDNKDCYFAAQRDKYQDAVFTIEAFFSSKLKALQRERELRTMNGVSEMSNLNLSRNYS
jgi:abnormal spindle-like microcephaly-associated protein